MTQDITSLIEKLEGAEVGSRELDAAVCDALILPDMRPRIVGHGQYDANAHVRTQSVNAGPSRSLDAALALAERVLPKLTRIEIKTYVRGEFHHCTIETDDDEFDVNNCRTPALALCAAILRAQSEAR